MPDAVTMRATPRCERLGAHPAMDFAMRTFGLLALLIILAYPDPGAARDVVNGFDLNKTSVPRELIAGGGPPRDGIPALTDPDFLPASEATYLKEDDRLLGVVYNGVAKAYPLPVMNWHELVNDCFDGEPVLVTYCPLCFTGMAFKAGFNGKRQKFGVSGLLYNSDVLLYDVTGESLWSQIMGEAIAGPRMGQPLESVPLVNTSWRDWRKRHPDTLVLSRETGHRRDYERDPYAWYDQSHDLAFPVAFRSHGYHPKEYVLGLKIDGRARAWPVSELMKAALPLKDRLGDKDVVIHYDDDNVTAEAREADGELLSGVMAYWFAWYAFHPQTEVYTADGDEKPTE